MAKFTSTRDLKIKWNGLHIEGAAGATHRIPDAYLDEFIADHAGLSPTLTWITQDEFTTISGDSATAIAAAIDTHDASATAHAAIIAAHAASATGHAHFSVVTNPHSVSAKQVAQVFSTADLSLDAVISLPGSTGDSHLNSIAFDGATIVTGSYSAGNVWVSHDKGMSWEDLGKPNGISAIDDIAWVMTDRPGQFWIGCSSTGAGARLLRSTDSGATWLQVMQASTTQATEGLSLCGGWGRVLLAASGQVASNGGARIWRSTDNGDQWSIVSSTETSKASIRQIIHLDNSVYIASAWGSSPNESKIYRSTDDGGSWASVQTIASADVYAALALPNGVALLGTSGTGAIYRSTNIGASFTSVASLGTGTSTVTGLLRMGSKVLAFVNQNSDATSVVYVSTDQGATWSLIGTLDPLYHAHMPIAVDDSTIIVPLSRNGYVAAGRIARMTFYG